MLRASLCKDGLAVDILSHEGLWIVLSDAKSSDVLGRFAVDPSELRALIDGVAAYQATDGMGNSASFDGDGSSLRIRVEGPGYSATRCQLDQTALEEVLRTIQYRV